MRYIEKYIQVVRVAGLNTKKAVDFSGSPSVALPAGTTIGGSVVETLGGLNSISSSSANAISIGPNGNTNPTFNIDASTASAATGINIVGAAAGAGVSLAAISSAANEALSIDAKGSGQLSIGTTSTGQINIAKSNSVVTFGQGNVFLTNTNGSPSIYSGFASKTFALKSANAAAVTASVALDTGLLTVNANTAVPAGGAAAAALLMSTTAALGLYFGSGAPTVSAAQGSVYIRTDGSSTSTRMYINTNGSTTWTAVTTAA